MSERSEGTTRLGSLVVTNIGELFTGDEIRTGAAVLLDGDRIAWVGDDAAAPAAD